MTPRVGHLALLLLDRLDGDRCTVLDLAAAADRRRDETQAALYRLERRGWVRRAGTRYHAGGHRRCRHLVLWTATMDGGRVLLHRQQRGCS